MLYILLRAEESRSRWEQTGRCGLYAEAAECPQEKEAGRQQRAERILGRPLPLIPWAALVQRAPEGETALSQLCVRHICAEEATLPRCLRMMSVSGRWERRPGSRNWTGMSVKAWSGGVAR